MCLFGYPFSFPRFFRSSSASSGSSVPSGREARVVVPTLQTIPDPPAANNPLPNPTPRFDIQPSWGKDRRSEMIGDLQKVTGSRQAPRPMPPAPPPIPPLRLEEIRQMLTSIPIHPVQNNRFDGFVDIDEAESSLRDSISRYSIASDRIISIENDRVDGVLEIDPESRNSIETQ